MSCDNCKDHVTDAEFLDAMEQHTARLETAFAEQLAQVVAQVRTQVDQVQAATTERPANTVIH